MMKINKTEITNYIPQRDPFIMIDNLVNASGDEFETDFCILPSNIFVENGLLREFALVENIAQSSSAGLAFTKISTGLNDGFIGAISKLRLYDLPPVNETLTTIVKLVARFENMFLLKGENLLNGGKLLECEIKLVGVSRK